MGIRDRANADASGPKPRQGKHPRDPARPARASATTDAQAQLPDGTDLGEHDEAGAIADEADRAASSGPSGSSSAAAPADRATRGPDTEPRTRRTFADQSSGTSNASDWTRFDVTKSLRALRSEDKAVRERELRKLHLRWWHCPKVAMTNILKAAGVDSTTIAIIPSIVDTCKECRAWILPGNETIPSLKLSIKFNQHIECDLMFYKDYIIAFAAQHDGTQRPKLPIDMKIHYWPRSTIYGLQSMDLWKN